MYKKQFGIKLKITIAFSLIFILLSFCFNMYCYRQIKKLMISDNDTYLLARAQTLLDKTELSPVIIPLPDNNTAIRISYHSGGKAITVFQSPGIIKDIRTPQKTGVTDTQGMRIAYVVSKNEENPAELLLVQSAAQLNSNLHYLLLLLFACSLISVLLAGLIAYILAFYLLQPVQRIINAAKIINANKLRDVIPVKNTNDELQELTETINKMLVRIDESLQQQQNFFASASHELKTPLAIMRAETDVQLMNKKLDEEVKTLLLSQLSEINRLQQVVQEFLLVSQLKSNGIALYKEPVDISSLVLKLFNKFKPMFDQKQLKAKINFDKEIESFTISADRDKLTILMINVIENAIKHAAGKSEITCNIRQTPDREYMQFTVINTTHIESFPTINLQDAFYRGDLSSSGSGLGLWLVSEIVKLHNGQLEISSNNYLFESVISLPMS